MLSVVCVVRSFVAASLWPTACLSVISLLVKSILLFPLFLPPFPYIYSFFSCPSTTNQLLKHNNTCVSWCCSFRCCSKLLFLFIFFFVDCFIFEFSLLSCVFRSFHFVMLDFVSPLSSRLLFVNCCWFIWVVLVSSICQLRQMLVLIVCVLVWVKGVVRFHPLPLSSFTLSPLQCFYFDHDISFVGIVAVVEMCLLKWSNSF